MKERPILFSAPMVRALLTGTKTQTRRALRVQPGPSCTIEEGMNSETRFVYSQLHGDGPGHEVHERRSPCPCPYGVPGDRLWVREAWAQYGIATIYRADSEQRPTGASMWHPSIHMRRAVCRITLEITGVRVERLQAISEVDCIAEGAPGGHGAIPDYRYAATPLEHYRHIWREINGAGSWDANPWVWVVEFQRISQP